MKISSTILLAALVAVPAFAADPTPQEKTAMIQLLQSAAPPQEKAKVCKQLAVFGDKEAVPALAALLGDPELSSWARIALEAIPDPSACEALRQGLGKVKGLQLVGVINSIGVRRDAQAVDALVTKLADADAETASAAAAALGRIGGNTAVKALEGAMAASAASVREVAAESCVVLAQRLQAEGKSADAVRLYGLVRNANVSKQRIREAIRGLILAQGDAGLPLLVEQLQSSDRRLFALGLGVAREIPNAQVTQLLLTELGRAAPARQALLILALADRGDAKSKAAVLQAAKSGAPELRLAAVRGLGQMRDVNTASLLLEIALESPGELAALAADILADLPGKEADDLVLARLATAQGQARLPVLELIGRRHIESATGVLLKAADDADVRVRAAALAALGATLPLADLPILAARVVAGGNPEEAKAAEAALRAACGRIADHDACAEKLLGSMANAPVPARCKLLGVLVVVGGDKALKAVTAAAKSNESAIRDAGYRALGEWTSIDAGPVLLDLVKTPGDVKAQTRALRAYIRIARQFVIPDAQRLAMFRQAMALAQRNEEKQLALDIMKQIKTTGSLSIVVGYLKEPALTEAAARVAVTLSDKLVASRPADVAKAMRQVVAVSKNQDTLQKARSLIDRAGNK